MRPHSVRPLCSFSYEHCTPSGTKPGFRFVTWRSSDACRARWLTEDTSEVEDPVRPLLLRHDALLLRQIATRSFPHAPLQPVTSLDGILLWRVWESMAGEVLMGRGGLRSSTRATPETRFSAIDGSICFIDYLLFKPLVRGYKQIIKQELETKLLLPLF